MGDLLREIQSTTRVQNNIDKFESLSLSGPTARSRSNSKSNTRPVVEVGQTKEPTPILTPVSSKTIAKTLEPAAESKISTDSKPVGPFHKKHDSTVFLKQEYLKDKPPSTLCDDAREILKSHPGIEDVEAVLTYLQYGIDGQHDFNVKITSPKASQIVRVLVTSTIPDLWPNMSMSKTSGAMRSLRQVLSHALFSVAGFEALLGEIRRLTSPHPIHNQELIRIYLDFLNYLLSGADVVLRLLRDCFSLYEKDVQQRLFWQSVVSIFAGSKILSATASLPNVAVESGETIIVPKWLLKGTEYSRWLARNISKAASKLEPKDTQPWFSLGQLVKRSLSLGYKDILVTEIYTALLLGPQALWTPLHKLLSGLATYDQKVVFECILDDLARNYLQDIQLLPHSARDMTTTRTISGAAALVNGLTSHNEYLAECAIDWLCETNSLQGKNGGIRRALFSALAQSQANLGRILERSLTNFSDKLQLNHVAITQQEHLAQTILLAIGYLHRSAPTSLKEDPIPSLVMQSVSNRLASSVPRIRLLGMIVGTGMSRCVDPPGKTINFDTEEMDTEEVQDFLTLIDVQDDMGDIGALQLAQDTRIPSNPHSKKRKIVTSPTTHVKRSEQTTARVMSIEEVSSSDEDEDDLVPYNKPNNDPEDSDDDPTLVDRDKPRPPIYIVDLIKQLNSPSDKPNVISLALATAAPLIRRKASFGTELFDNIHSLASALINLREGVSKSEPQQQRLDALIACLVAQPEQMGRYFTNTYFEGDFSLSQRSTLLIAIGMGARELAGFPDTKSHGQRDTDLFPSERLPSHLQPKPVTAQDGSPKRQLTSNPISALSSLATMSTIKPLAEAAASSQAGPEFLKIAKTIRTSSSLSLKSAKQSNKTKALPRNIHNMLANNIYIALISPLTAILTYTLTPTGSRTNTTLLHSSIVCLHLQTLTLVLHTLGPTGLSPPNVYMSITHETILLLSSLQRNTRLVLDPVILPSALSLFLALIDITVEIGVTAQERLLGGDVGDQVAELVRWVSGLESMNGVPPPSSENGRGEEGIAWTVVAAGIQVRWWEIGKRFQGRMLGLEVDD